MFSVCCLLIVAASVSQVFTANHRPVVVLSFDGIQADEINANNTPYLYETLKPIAAGPKYMKTTFPSKTFVTHHTAATGVHPEVHGVIANKRFDSRGNEVVYLPEQFQTNQAIVPIWITNEIAPEKNSACMMWPGSDFEYKEGKPKNFKSFNPKLDWNERIKVMINWMAKREHDPINLMMAYFEDSSSPDDNPDQNEKVSYMKKVDNAIKLIYEELEKLDLASDLNLILMSDHGTSEVKANNFLVINEYVPSLNEEEIIAQGPDVLLKPKPEELENIYKLLKNNNDHNNKYTVYKQEEIPDNWHLKKSSNLKDTLLVVAKIGYTFFEKSEYNRLKNSNDMEPIQENGYDNNEKSMNAFFWGIGPDFKNNVFPDESFEIIEIYPLLIKLLELEAPAGQKGQAISTTLNSLLE